MLKKIPSTSWLSSKVGGGDDKKSRQQLNVRNLTIFHIPELNLSGEDISFSPCDSFSDMSTSPPDSIPEQLRRKSLATVTVNLKSKPSCPDIKIKSSQQHRRSHSSTSHDDELIFPSSPRSSSLFRSNTPSSPSKSRFSLKKLPPPTSPLQFISLNVYRPYYESNVPLEFPSSCLKKKEEMTAAHLFWLLNRIKESIIHGTLITPKLYLPKELWHHSQSIPNLSTKIQQLQSLIHHLAIMSKANLNNLSQVRSFLNEFDTISQSILLTKPQMNKPLSTIMKNMLLPTPKSPGLDDYKNTLLVFINHCAILETWYYHFLWSSTPAPLTPSIQHGLYRATLFITHSILSPIMSDIHQLMDTYLTQLTYDLLL